MYERGKIDDTVAIESRERTILFIDIACIIEHSINTVINGATLFIRHSVLFARRYDARIGSSRDFPGWAKRFYQQHANFFCAAKRSNSRRNNTGNSRSLLLSTSIADTVMVVEQCTRTGTCIGESDAMCFLVVFLGT